MTRIGYWKDELNGELFVCSNYFHFQYHLMVFDSQQNQIEGTYSNKKQKQSPIYICTNLINFIMK
jgi:hypothetical protein